MSIQRFPNYLEVPNECLRCDGYKMHVYHSLQEFTPDERVRLQREFDRLAVANFIIDPEFFRKRGDEDFPADGHLYLIFRNRELIAFSIVRFLSIQGKYVVLRWMTNVHPDHQGAGVHSLISKHLLSEQRRKGHESYLALSTRSPIVYQALAKRCRRVAPDFSKGYELDTGAFHGSEGDLVQIADSIALNQYHYHHYDPASMSFSDAFQPGCRYHEEPHAADFEFDRVFYAHPVMGNPVGCFMVVGEPLRSRSHEALATVR